MNEIQNAYFILGLEAGVPLERVLTRYKQLVKTWHPDRAYTDEDKAYYNEELKKINNAKDIIKDHFDKGKHTTSGPCECRTENKEQKTSNSQSSYQRSSSKQNSEQRKREEEETRRRNEEEARSRSEERQRQEEAERQRQAAEDELKAARAKAEAQATATKSAMKQKENQKAESLQWKLTLVAGIIFVIFCLASIAAQVIKDPIIASENAISGSDSSNKSEQEKQEKRHSDYIDDRQSVASQLLGHSVSSDEAANWQPPFSSSDSSSDSLSQEVYKKFNPPVVTEQPAPVSADVLEQLRQRFRPDQIAGLKSDIYTFQFQLTGLQNQIKNIDTEIATETSKIQEDESKMSSIQQSIGTNFMYNAADQRLHPMEYSGWQGLSSMAEVARSRIESMQSQKRDLELDCSNLQAKIDKAQAEIQNLGT